MNDRIFMSSPDVGLAEREAILAAFDSGWIAPAGPDLDAFERELAERVGVAHSVALGSGTAALHLGLLGLGVGPGDLVVTATMTFAATANAITYTGAEPVFVDCDPVTGNIDTQLLDTSLRQLRREGAVVKAIVPVDLLGRTVDYTHVLGLAEEHGLPVLADAAESLGARHRGQAAGSFGRASVVSFNGNKIMTTSGGGMLLSDDEDFIARARYLSTQARQPVSHYEHTDIGFNYRLSNLLAALGRAQLGRLDEMMRRRREIREHYRALFTPFPGITIFQGDDDGEDNCWLTSVIVDPDVAGFEPSALRSALAHQNIESRPLWKPMHLQPVFAHRRAFTNGSSQRIFETGLTLPSGSALSESELARVTEALVGFLSRRRSRQPRNVMVSRPR